MKTTNLIVDELKLILDKRSIQWKHFNFKRKDMSSI